MKVKSSNQEEITKKLLETNKEWIEEDRNNGGLSEDVYQYYADNMNEIELLIENL